MSASIADKRKRVANNNDICLCPWCMRQCGLEPNIMPMADFECKHGTFLVRQTIGDEINHFYMATLRAPKQIR